MRNQYKILAEKYEQVLEADQEPVMTVKSSGDKQWRLKNGKLHRLDGPAVEWADGTESWFQNGYLHRLDGPAVKYRDGTSVWKRHGKHHRLDGPAIEWASGAKDWWQNGKRHRLDGPAIINPYGSKGWFINGKEYSENEFNKEIWYRNPARQNILKKASGKAGIEMDI